MDAMDRFVSRENIERYRRLSTETADATERLRILKLLAEEEAKFKLELSAQRRRSRRTIIRQRGNRESGRA